MPPVVGPLAAAAQTHYRNEWRTDLESRLQAVPARWSPAFRWLFGRLKPGLQQSFDISP